MGKILDITDKLDFRRVADIFSYWGDVPRNVRLHFYLKKARKEQSFMTILEYIEESELSEEDMQRLMKLSDEDIFKIMRNDARKAKPAAKLMALMKGFDQHYGDQFDHALVEERYKLGKFVYDKEQGYWIEP